MTGDEANAWLAARWPTAMPKLERYVALLLTEAMRQSLIARSTIECVWARHIVDSAQLVAFAGTTGAWLDVGSGGGLPGIIMAILTDHPITLVEPRRKRVQFLEHCVQELRLGRVTIMAAKAEAMTGRYAMVTARAVASIDQLFASTIHLVSRETRYLLPRGRSGRAEVIAAGAKWNGKFHVEPSITDRESVIAIASGVTRR